MRRTALLLVAVALLAGCGKSNNQAEQPKPAASGTVPTTASTSTLTTTTTTGPTNVAARVYFLRNGKVSPVLRYVAAESPATFALNQLAGGPNADEGNLTNAYQGGVEIKRIAAGTATIQLIADLPREALAQVVYTLTQFPTVQRVRTTRSAGSGTMTRATFEDFTPAILIESPLPNQHVRSPLRVSGTANTFEATFALDIRNSSNQTFTHQIVTATSGSGTRGTFDTTISFTASDSITLVAYEPSAENGRPLHTVRVPLVTD